MHASSVLGDVATIYMFSFVTIMQEKVCIARELDVTCPHSLVLLLAVQSQAIMATQKMVSHCMLIHTSLFNKTSVLAVVRPFRCSAVRNLRQMRTAA